MSIEPTCSYCNESTKFRCRTLVEAEECLEEKRKNSLHSRRHKQIFVFGSNLAGRHGKGAALYARKEYGAVYGEGVGRTGMAYGIPTKDGDLQVLSIDIIREHVKDYNTYVNDHPNLTFLTTPFGTGLAGYDRLRILGLMQEYKWPKNLVFTKEWLRL